jgi:hypothetical protein
VSHQPSARHYLRKALQPPAAEQIRSEMFD